MNKLAVAYCRVSTDEQADKGLSMDVQEEACTRAIQEQGFNLLKVIRDEGKSAGTLNRPGIRELIGLVENEEINAVFTISSDRMNRNTGDYLWLTNLFRKNDIELRYVYQANLDDSATSRTMGTIMATFNELTRLQTSEKVKKVLGAKVLAGYFPELAPVGYKNTDNTDPKADRLARKVIMPDSMAPLVTEAFRLFSTGDFNGYDLCDLMGEKGLRTRNGKRMLPSRFYELLKNRVYIGEVRWGKITNPEGKHEPLIDKETFQRVQMVLQGHNKHACRRRKYTWLLSGFVHCPRHGKRYTAEWHLNKKISYYHCTNKSGCGRYIETGKLEEMVADKFKNLEFHPDFINKIIEKAKASFYQSRSDYDAKRQALVNQRTAYEAKLAAAETKMLEGTLLDEDYKRIRTGIKREISTLEERIHDLNNRQEVKLDIAKEILSFASDIHVTYKNSPPNIKRHILSLFWNKFEVQEGVIIKSVPSMLFQHLIELQQMYLKNQNPQNTGDFDVLINSTTGLRGQDSNLEPSR